jgi:hypothetical protein
MADRLLSNSTSLPGLIDGRIPAFTNPLANPLSPSKAASLPWEDFDRAEGTLVNGMTTKSGHTFLASGPGATAAAIGDNGVVNTDNVYMGFTWTNSGTPITEVWGVISFKEVGTGGYTTGPQAVLMFNNGGPVDLLNGLIHIEFTPTGYSPKITTNGAANLAALGGTVTEVNGNDVGAGIYRLKVDGSKYLVGLVYVQKASAALDELYIHLPDGKIVKYVGDTKVRTVMTGCYWGTAQIQTPVSNGFQPRWHALHYGPRRSNVLRALSGAAKDTDTLPLREISRFHKRRQRIVMTPTATGWYTIANASDASGVNTFLGGVVRISARDAAGRQEFAELACGIEATDAPRIQRIDRPYGTWASGPTVSRIRLSRDSSAGGAKQLEIYFAQYSGSTDITVIDLEGQFEPILSPVVGSTALTGYSREQSLVLTQGPSLLQANNTDITLTPGVDNPRQVANNANSPAKTISLDDAKAIDGDFFVITRTGTNPYNVANLSDAVVLKSLAQNTWGRFDRSTSTGKFVLTEYGTL